MREMSGQTDEEREFIDMALAAADAGNAGHWPTVAGYLADEVRRLRALDAALPHLATSPPARPSTFGYIVRYHDPDGEGQNVSWDNRVYTEYREAAMAAIGARDKFRAPGHSWTVCRTERMATFR